MKKIVVNDIYDFSEKILNCASVGATVYVALFYDEAVALMRALIEDPEVSIGHIDLDEDSEYQKEYYVILDETYTLSVERAWQDGDNAGYLRFTADALLVDGEASYAIVRAADDPDCLLYELTIDDHGLYSCDIDYPDEDHDDYDEESESSLCLLDKAISHIINIIYGKDGDDSVIGNKEVLDYVNVINRRFAKNGKWDSENCYYFAVILKDRFPGGDIYYDVINGHFSYKYNGVHYDHTGAFVPDGYLVRWDDFDDYDCIQKARIVRDCIL